MDLSSLDDTQPTSEQDVSQPQHPEPQPAAPVEPGSSQPAGSQALPVPGGEEELLIPPVIPDTSETMPVKAAPPGGPGQPPPGAKPARPRRGGRALAITMLVLLILIAAGVVGAFAGYQQGIGLRTSAASTQVASRLQEQFDLGVQDLEAKQYDRARQRFEYVIQLDPSYPGVTEKLAAVLLEINTTATPTLVPTPTLTPTPDTRSVDDKFRQAQEALNNKDWTKTIDTLLELRKADPTYHAVDIDGMIYLALRNRGMEKIARHADLEGGLYDLSLAARFAPLDSEAAGYETWTRMYITGASFWDIDWKQAVEYFSQIAPQLPNLTDGSGLTASERYRQALIGYGEQLAKQGEWCEAQAQLEQGLAMGADEQGQVLLDEATNNCAAATAPQPQPGEEATPGAGEPVGPVPVPPR